MTPSCPGSQQASCAYKVIIRLYNCVQGLRTLICSDSELSLTHNHLSVLSNQLIKMSFLGLKLSHMHDRGNHCIMMCAVTLIIAKWLNQNEPSKLLLLFFLLFLIINRMMNKKMRLPLSNQKFFPFLNAYFSKHQTPIHSPQHHIQRLQWIKVNIQVLSVEMNWYLI